MTLRGEVDLLRPPCEFGDPNAWCKADADSRQNQTDVKKLHISSILSASLNLPCASVECGPGTSVCDNARPRSYGHELGDLRCPGSFQHYHDGGHLDEGQEVDPLFIAGRHAPVLLHLVPKALAHVPLPVQVRIDRAAP